MRQFNTDRLRGRMVERGYNIKTLAEAIGVHPNTLSHKLYGNRYFTTREIADICMVLAITEEQIPYYFFSL